MLLFSRLRPALVAVAIFAAPAAFAQSSPGYFMPPSQSAPAQPAPQPAPPQQAAPPQEAVPQPQPQPQTQQIPAIPKLPALPPSAPPPPAVIGVLSVPEVMQKSTAAQGVQQVIQQRQQALGADAQRARARLQSQLQGILAERGKLSDADLAQKEQDLRNEAAALQTKFALRNQAIQNSGQAALGQIESELIAIIKEEAEAHGMNLVLHREQVALNVQAFDITDAVAARLNELLPSVQVPPSVVTPGMVVNPPQQDQDGGDGGGQ